MALRPWRTREGWIYFVQAESGGPIKIGFAADVFARLADLQSASPLTLRLLAGRSAEFWQEKRLHERHKAHRLHGEWFAPHDDVLRDVAAAKAGPQPAPALKTPAESHKDEEADAQLRAVLQETFSDVISALEDRMPRHKVARMFASTNRSVENWAKGEVAPSSTALMNGARNSALVRVWMFALSQAVQKRHESAIDLRTIFTALMDDCKARIAAGADADELLADGSSIFGGMFQPRAMAGPPQ